jgi:hypothetical protein
VGQAVAETMMERRVEFDAHKLVKTANKSCVKDEVRREGLLYCSEADQGTCSSLIQGQAELSLGRYTQGS